MCVRPSSVGDGRPTQFLHVKESDLESYVGAIADGALQESIKSGVAYYHEGMTGAERSAVEALFAANAIQVRVVASVPLHVVSPCGYW